MTKDKTLRKKKKTQITNKKLIKKYPWLIPRNDWTGKVVKGFDYTWHEADAMGTGWWRAFGLMMCDEIDQALKRGGCVEKYRIMQIKEKYGCYDDQTEVLTKNGWKYFKDITYEDQIMTLGNNDNIEYQFPTDIIIEKYKGQMYHLENRGLSICVTPNHNLYIAKGSYYYGKKNNEKRLFEFELTTPDKYFGKDKRFKKGGAIWNGKNPFGDTFTIKGGQYTNSGLKSERTYIRNDVSFDMMSWMRFLGFYVAEGSTNYGAKNLRDAKGGEITVAYNPYDEEDLVISLIKGIGFEPKNHGYGLKALYSTVLAKWLKENCGHKAWNKKVPEFIKKMPKEYIEEFLKYLYIGDGHKTRTSNILTTTSKQLSNDVQELLIKCGYCFREYEYDHRNRLGGTVNGRPIIQKHIQYDINWLKLQDIEIDMSKASNAKSFVEKWEEYKGIVYCVTVPNHVIYVRRNGKGYWCGNSLRWYDFNGTHEVSRIIDKYSYISEHICWCCGKPDVAVTNAGWLLPLCKECFEKEERHKCEYEDVIDLESPNEIPISYTVTHFSKDGDWDETIDISDTVEKIRRQWQKRERKRLKARAKRETKVSGEHNSL